MKFGFLEECYIRLMPEPCILFCRFMLCGQGLVNSSFSLLMKNLTLTCQKCELMDFWTVHFFAGFIPLIHFEIQVFKKLCIYLADFVTSTGICYHKSDCRLSVVYLSVRFVLHTRG